MTVFLWGRVRGWRDPRPGAFERKQRLLSWRTFRWPWAALRKANDEVRYVCGAARGSAQIEFAQRRENISQQSWILLTAPNGINDEYKTLRAPGPMVPLSSGRNLSLGQYSLDSGALCSRPYGRFCLL